MLRKHSIFLSGLLVLWALGSNLSAQPRKQKILLDSDLGSDIDDAFAMALILSSPEFEVVGIALDHGLTDKRAQIACRLLHETGMEHIPVAVGRRTDEVVGTEKSPATYAPQFFWAEGFSKLKPVRTPASDFIIEMLRKYPHELVVFTIGPVPNIGDVIEKDPDALKLAKRVYCMFGSFYMGYDSSPVPSAEWNVRADVASAKRLAASGAALTYAGLDITTFVKLDERRRQKLLMRQSPLTNALCALYALWGQETPVLYDVVAIGMSLWPDLFVSREAAVRVIDGGFTTVEPGKTPNCQLGVSIDKEEFLDRLMKRLLQQNLGRE